MRKKKKNADRLELCGDLGLFPTPVPPEVFHLNGDSRTILRKVTVSKYEGFTTFPYADDHLEVEIDAAFEKSWLTASKFPVMGTGGPNLRVVDLFAGCGGLSVGIQAAASALGGNFESVFASDIDESALQVYSSNLSPMLTSSIPIEEMFSNKKTDKLNPAEKSLKKKCKDIDFLIGGPPCQGHSDLNNHTRRNDPRNELYSLMGRAAAVLQPRYIVIENVLGVRHSSTEVVQKTTKFLNDLGYNIASIMLNAANYGVPQNRKRHFTLATSGDLGNLGFILESLERKARPVMWAIDDIIDEPESNSDAYRTSAVHSSENMKRINYLFNHGLYELPDSERPDCHRLKPHAYNSVYGRMRPEGPAPTITSGFGSTGQGRFVHPFRRRTITPHEAARIQFFPDWFSFGGSGRRQLQKFIGNAVPPKLGYVIGLALLSTEETK